VRFIPSIDQGPALHGVNALQIADEITALRKLEGGPEKLVLLFQSKLAGPGYDLASDQKSLDPLHEGFPRQRPGQKIILMATVAVASEIRIVFVKPDFTAALLREPLGAGHQDPFTGSILSGQLGESAALWGAVF